MRGFIVVPEFTQAPATGVEKLRGRELIELRRCDFDPELKAVQCSAEARNGVGVAVNQPIVGCFERAQCEQFDRRIDQRFARVAHFHTEGGCQRLDALQLLAAHSKRLAAGRKDAATDLRLEEPSRDRRGRGPYVLAIVQDDQNAPVLQVSHHGRDQVRRIAMNA